MPKNKPQIRCDNCQELNILKFDPRKSFEKLKKIRCKRCRRLVINKVEREKMLIDDNILNGAEERDRKSFY